MSFRLKQNWIIVALTLVYVPRNVLSLALGFLDQNEPMKSRL